MRKQYKVLGKNVEELETQFATLLSFPPNIPVPKLLVDDFNQRLGFVRNLLAAEQHGTSDPERHLGHLASVLDHLDHLFRRWSAGDLDIKAFDNEINMLKVDSCSCSESCFNDDDKEDEEDRPSEGGDYFEIRDETASLEENNEDENFRDCLDAEIRDNVTSVVVDGKRKKNKTEMKNWGLMLLLVFVLVLIVVGFGVIIVTLFLGYSFDCYYYYSGDNLGLENFLTPT